MVNKLKTDALIDEIDRLEKQYAANIGLYESKIMFLEAIIEESKKREDIIIRLISGLSTDKKNDLEYIFKGTVKTVESMLAFHKLGGV